MVLIHPLRNGEFHFGSLGNLLSSTTIVYLTTGVQYAWRSLFLFLDEKNCFEYLEFVGTILRSLFIIAKHRQRHTWAIISALRISMRIVVYPKPSLEHIPWLWRGIESWLPGIAINCYWWYRRGMRIKSRDQTKKEPLRYWMPKRFHSKFSMLLILTWKTGTWIRIADWSSSLNLNCSAILVHYSSSSNYFWYTDEMSCLKLVGFGDNFHKSSS